MHSLITIIGPISSGKTTVSQILSEHLHLPLIDADLFEENPFLEGFIKDPQRWAFSVELFFTIKRLKKLSTLNKILEKSSVVVDSGLLMSQIFTRNQLVQANMTASEWSFYEEIVADYQTKLPQPSIVVALTAKPETQLARIKARGRSFESGYTLEYLQQITDRLTEYVKSLENQKNIQLITYDTEAHNPLDPSGKTFLLDQISPLL